MNQLIILKRQMTFGLPHDELEPEKEADTEI